MANTSASGGYLSPAQTPAPLEDIDLDKLFASVAAIITGLPGKMVRPRWQPQVPKQPETDIDWCAIGAMVTNPDAGPAITHNSDGDGADEYVRHEEIEVLASFYGPNCQGFAGKLRDGLAIPQNCEALRANDIAFVECGRIVPVPEFINQKWQRRRDILLRFRRKISRVYPVLNVLSADVNLIDDTHVDINFETTPPPVKPPSN